MDKLQLLLKKISESDETAFKELVAQYYNRLMNFTCSFIEQKEIAEELVMDAFLKLWHQRETLLSIRNFETYSYVLVRNQALNYLRKSKSDVLKLIENNNIELAPIVLNPEQTIISKEVIEQVNCAIEALPPKCKMIFKLLREEGQSRKEVASILDISVKTIDAQMAIAVERIAKALNIDLKKGSNRVDLQAFMLLV
ncbi:MAG: RNA polymerase sigma-70 factor [Carboxylicivirga sp.]|jgi:RNA polymerase sigma-70 factor (ECF subfamily)|nr:RNA polymerase sigma-70 factor [Carboxylicivirga sp.]